MALKDRALRSGETPDTRTASAIEAELRDGKLPCSAAFSIARDLSITPQAIGHTADLLNVRLSRCQLGFFGYAERQGYAEANTADLDIPEGLTEAIRAAQDNAGDVSCSDLWNLAATYAVQRMLVGYITDQLNIHVTPCQLGAF